jgi:hypothetical protein
MSNVVELRQTGVRARLRQAWDQRMLVRVWRSELESASFTGYVAHLGREYFLLWVLGDYIGFDGLYALRYLETPDKNQKFLERAIAMRGIVPSWPESFPLDDAEGAVRAAMAAAEVIGVHVDTEGQDEVCYVGRVVGFEADGFLMQEITPDAEWLTENSFFGFDEVSALALQGPYHAALAQVAGPPPDGVRATQRDRGFH